MPLSRYVCIGLVSAAALLFQVAQTRLFSASYGYHLTYLVISVSLLGVGSGATLSGIFDSRPRRPGVATLALAAAASAVAVAGLRMRTIAGLVAASAMTVALTLAGDAIAPPQSGPAKRPVYGENITHLATRWDPHARVDVLYYDGLAAGEMYRNLIDPAYAASR